MQLGLAAVAAIVLVLLWGFWMSLRIDNQNEPQRLPARTEITQLDAKHRQDQGPARRSRDHLLARKQIIEQLQANRSQMVHLFDELVKTIPASARITSLKQTGRQADA